MIRWGACEACSCKDSEIAFLRSLVRPTPEPRYRALPSPTMEADAILSGTDMQITLEDTQEDREQGKRQAEIDSEAAKILSANY